MRTLTKVQGIDKESIERLQAAGISSFMALMQVCIMANGRTRLAERTGIPRTTILDWAHQADLLRINGVGPDYARLLRAAGVETVPDLSRRNAANLRKKMVAVSGVKPETCSFPSEAEIKDWIGQAQRLPRIIQY